MKISDSFVLPDDIIIVEAETLPDGVRSQFTYESGDFIVSRPRTRNATQVISKQTAELLQAFKTPETIVQAIINYSTKSNQVPQSLLEEAYPFIERFIAQGILVAPDSDQAAKITPTFEDQGVFEDLEIVRCVRIIQDTEVYQVRDSTGTLLALKLARPRAGQHIQQLFEREVAILSHLDGAISPTLFRHGTHDDRPYLLMEWCEGIDVLSTAQSIKLNTSESIAESRIAILKLCVRVLLAYTQLHENGVIHGDVHPGNIIVGENGTLKIIDFGLARIHNAPGTALQHAPRGAIPFYLEPEMASAMLNNEPQPLSSFLGEQYALATVLYTMITGTPYLDFSIDREAMLTQIAKDAPVPFYMRGAGAWSLVEETLNRALSKAPQARFPSLPDFAQRWNEIIEIERHNLSIEVNLFNPDHRRSLTTLLTNVLKRTALNGEWLQAGLPSAPLASVNYGAAGIAYALYRIACAQESADLLTLAEVWLSRAFRDSSKQDAFESDALGINKDVVGKISPYHTFSGLCVVQALISHGQGDAGTLQMAIERYLAHLAQPCDSLDLALGKASTLLSSAMLMNIVGTHKSAIVAPPLKEQGQHILAEIWAQLDSYAPISECAEIKYLGIAHGWAGLCYSTLRWCQTTSDLLPDNLEERLSQLANLAEPYGQGVRWKWFNDPSVQGENYMPGWCNGSAGHVHLWTTAYRQFGKSNYLELATKAAWHTYAERGQLGNLCCGLAGQAYALLNLYSLTQERAWLERGYEIAELAASNTLITSQQLGSLGSLANEIPDHSLYKGQVGVAVLAAELENIELASMPFFGNKS